MRALRAPGAGSRPRSFFDRLNDWAREAGASGLGYLIYDEAGAGQGPIARNLEDAVVKALAERTGAEAGDALFFVAGEEKVAVGQAGLARDEVARRLDETRAAGTPALIEENAFRFCWVTDFPMYEADPKRANRAFRTIRFLCPKAGCLP